MIYPDKIYGSIDLTEPVLLDLMDSQAMQRLQGVLQHGITAVIGLTSGTTRFDHSVGAMLLVKHLGGLLPEQIAALLHDVSHTAFSHVIDYVYAQHTVQSYHDEKKAWYVAQTDIPTVLDKHGYAWQDFLDEGAYPLLEQPAPALCADRVDYFLRDALDLGLLSQADIQFILAHLTVSVGRIVTNQVDVAQKMAYTYLAADEASWCNFREVALYELTAQAIRLGLEIEAITEADIWATDAVLWHKLQQSNHPELQAKLSLISTETEFVRDEQDPTFWVGSKVRTIDPDVITETGLQPLSTLDTTFAQHRADYIARKQGQWPIRVQSS